ncbi:hypothetical protein [Croceimicrobium hydrocarbonivorans]|uniref:Uncharacterized protein n=1 Tax=Croceimicrobium hydrocarbonivorans TaxID=2761580 RepID=A0A7H0VEM6_9FLAO|nr:hypothetical protein [Croceimicrobium hydrocarbonivorans]QNR24174.1 hypothetical protein H4K34_17660 [Croceimicrobium hydrocarbonivorans]
MMNSTAFDNLEKLSQDLYQKLISDAQSEIESLQAEAAKEREALLNDARTKAEQYQKEAERQADLYKERRLQELKQESLHLREKLQRNLEGFLKAEVLEGPTDKAFEDQEFIEKLLLKLLEQFDPKSYQLQWPKDWQAESLAQLQKKLPDWQFEIRENARLSLQSSEAGLEFRIDAEAFKALLDEYFNQELRDLILQND